MLARILLLVVCSLALTGANGASPDYLADFPSVDRVLTEIKGRDDRDTQAKQIGALRQLWHMVASLAPGRAETPEETRLRQAYNVASGQIDRPMMATFSKADTERLGFKSPRAQWVALCAMYETDEALREELLSRFFSPSFRTRFAQLIADGHRVQKHTADELGQTGAGEAPQWLVDMPWYKGPAYVLAAVTAVCALWLLGALAGEFKAFGLAPDNPRELRAGRRRFDITSVTGIVVKQTKATYYNTRITRWIDPQNNNRETESSVTTRKVIHNFELAQPDGTSPITALQHHDAELATGAWASVINVVRRGKEYGDSLVYVDHDRNLRTYDRSRLRKLFRPRYTLLVSGIALLMCLGLYSRAITDYPLNRANFPTLFDFSGSVAQDFYNVIVQQWVPGGWRWLGVIAVAVILFHLIGRSRAATFVKRGADPLVAELESAAARQGATGFSREAALQAHPSPGE
jgi:hypothetical protein